MSPQRLLCPLWHESLAQPLISWVSGRPGHGRFVYGSAGLAATDELFGNELRNLWLTCAAVAGLGEADPPSHASPRAHQPYSSPDHRGDFDGEKPAKVPTVFEFRKVRFIRAGCAILRNPFRGVICPVGGVAGRYDRRK
jgi:hypothetical protein